MTTRKIYAVKDRLLKLFSYNGKLFQLPEKWKGGRIERWSIFWQNLYLDYKTVAVETIQEAKSRPRKTIMISSGLGIMYAAIQSNPDEHSFYNRKTECINELAMVGDPIRNPAAENHIESLNRSENQGLLRRTDLLFFALIWKADYDKDCNIYPAQCKYLKPQFLTFYNRIVDVGIFGTWLNLKLKMQDFDINPDEWAEKKL